MIGILPAAGLALRMRGLPKFLLPCSETYESLLERHLQQLVPYCDEVWIPTRDYILPYLREWGLLSGSSRAIPVNTETMTETIKVALDTDAKAEHFVLAMPDTYFLQSEFSYGRFLEGLAEEFGDSTFHLAAWDIRVDQVGKVGQIKLNDRGDVIESVDKQAKCTFPHLWGSMAFSRKVFEAHMQERDPHTGYGIARAISTGARVTATVIEGEYFDCGTPSEYWSLLSRLTSNGPSAP